MMRLRSQKDKKCYQDLINLKREIQYKQEELKCRDKYTPQEQSSLKSQMSSIYRERDKCIQYIQ